MSGIVLRWTGVAILIAGVLIYTFAPVSPMADATTVSAAPWLIPVGYFAMLAGVALLGWGWFRKQQ